MPDCCEDCQVPPCTWWWGQMDPLSQHRRETVPQAMCPPPPATNPAAFRSSPATPTQGPPALSRSDLCLHEDQDEDQQGGDSSCYHHPGRERTGTAQGRDEPRALMGGRHREPCGHCQLLHGRKEDGVQGHSLPMLRTPHSSCSQQALCSQYQGSRKPGCEQLWGKLVFHLPESLQGFGRGQRMTSFLPEPQAHLSFGPQPHICSHIASEALAGLIR